MGKVKKKKVFVSIEEIEKEYFPNNYKMQKSDNLKDPKVIGGILAHQSLNKIKKKISI